MKQHQIRVCIVEDNKLFAQHTKNLLEQSYVHLDIDLCDEHTYHQKEDYLIYILDIELGSKNGFEIARELREKHTMAAIVFLTSHEEMARKGYHYQAAGFVSKQEMETELLFVMDHIIPKLQNLDRIQVLDMEGRSQIVFVQEVIYALADGHYCEVCVGNQMYRVRSTLSNLVRTYERLLYDTSRGEAVNLAHIRAIQDGVLYLDNGTTLKLSRRNEKKVRDAFTQYQLHTI